MDKEGDKIKFEVTELSTIFNFELTKQNRVKISMAQQMKAEFTGLHRFNFQLSNDNGVKNTPTFYSVTIVIGLYDAQPMPIETIEPEVVEAEAGGEGEYALVPPSYSVDSSSDWIRRRGIDERKAQLKIHPFSSDGVVKVTFTKPVEMPEAVLALIVANKLVNITFTPSTYDFEE